MSTKRIFRALARRFAAAGGSLAPARLAARPAARLAVVVAVALSAAACGRDKPRVTAGQTLTDEELKQKCADEQWRDKNLGIWYAVCRKPVGW